MTVRQDLTDANSRISRRIVDGAASLAQVAFLNLGDWRDVDADRYLKLIRDPLTSLKNEGAKSTVAFYKAISDLDGQDFSAPTIAKNSLATSVLRNGVAEDVVWKRPFVTMRTALAQGKSLKESIELGASRAGYLASTEVQLARRNAGLQVRSSNDRIVGYIRTLTGFENCALCYVASTQRYTRGELLPIHPGCDCGEMPLYGTTDPGQVIDEMRLSKTHQAIEERFGISDRGAREPDYRKILIADHGEIGPTLTVRTQKFTGPNDLDLKNKKTKPPKDAREPDYYGLGLKTQPLGQVELDPEKVKAKVNPRRNESRSYQENCTNCVVTYDLRRRGYDVEAKPLLGGRPTRVMVMESYNMPDGSEMKFSDYLQRTQKIQKNKILRHIVDNNPVGSRGFIWGAWGRTNDGHIWIWEITEDKKIRFIEPQNPNPVSTRHYIKDITRTQYIRTDDLKPKPGVSRFVEDSRQ